MYDKTSSGILREVYLEPGIHKRALSRKLNLGMPSIEHALKKIEEMKLLKKEKSGNQIKYFLDYSKHEIVPVLYLIEYLRFEKLPIKVKFAIRDFLKELKEKPLMMIIFGSYAKNNYTKSSDIDVLLVYQKVNSRDIEDTAKRITMKDDVLISPAYLDYDSFKEAFHNPTKEFFKNLKKDKIILIGIEWWRELKNEEA